MKILIIGSGGREHALAWTLSRDPDTAKIYAAPGNPGIGEIGTCVSINVSNMQELASLASRERIDLTVVGPEAPLGAGIVDTFRKMKLPIFGPDKSAARIETSKSFAKDLCSRYNIPTPRWETFTDGDVGPNTGGMGVYAPVPMVTEAIVDKVRRKILDPSADAMAKENVPF